MAWTQADLEAIETAIKNGTSEVQYADKRVKYRSLEELKEIRAMISKELDTSKPGKITYAEFSKGT